jgi:tRNA (Thr-GGU) A37 N-methylase
MSFDVAIGCLEEYKKILASRKVKIETDKDGIILHSSEYAECLRQIEELDRAIAVLIFKEQ